jgi:photosystem II stability/assembly factor-like uncharacterized protein
MILRTLFFLSALAAVTSPPLPAQWAPAHGPDGGYVFSLGSSGSYLLAGTHGKGAYRSSDYGANWAPAASGLIRPHVYSFLTYGSNLFAACPGGGGVAVSTNDGSTWSSSNSGLWNYEAYSLARVDTDIFVATMGGGVFRSTDAGAYWQAVNSGLGIYSIWRLAVEGNILIAGTYGGGLYTSPDHGESWTKSDTGITNAYVEQFAVSDSGIFAGNLEEASSGQQITAHTGPRSTAVPAKTSRILTYVHFLRSAPTSMPEPTREFFSRRTAADHGAP